MVYYERKKAHGDWEHTIMSPPLCYADDSGAYIILFNVNILIQDSSGKSTMQNFIGWGHPDLIFHLGHGPLNLFFDCTFKVVPKGFTQLFVLMVYLPGFDSYVPIFYVLMQSKCLNAYKVVLSNIIFSCDWKLQAKSITSDFEQPLMQALREELGKTVPFIGCEFHWKC
jgi:hypothetical protein